METIRLESNSKDASLNGALVNRMQSVLDWRLHRAAHMFEIDFICVGFDGHMTFDEIGT